mmetsp:Transcript_92818/g.240256  ORF Transcript_92818/g.240256 Transcript_92818/m.240256 type:complete len:218 (-) Transcript_92818:1824-2477(-)
MDEAPWNRYRIANIRPSKENTDDTSSSPAELEACGGSHQQPRAAASTRRSSTVARARLLSQRRALRHLTTRARSCGRQLAGSAVPLRPRCRLAPCDRAPEGLACRSSGLEWAPRRREARSGEWLGLRSRVPLRGRGWRVGCRQVPPQPQCLDAAPRPGPLAARSRSPRKPASSGGGIARQRAPGSACGASLRRGLQGRQAGRRLNATAPRGLPRVAV